MPIKFSISVQMSFYKQYFSWKCMRGQTVVRIDIQCLLLITLPEIVNLVKMVD